MTIAPPIQFVSANSSTITFPNAQTAGNLNVAIVTWSDNTSVSMNTPTDTKGNIYSRIMFAQLACGDGNTGSIEMWIAPNIKAAAAAGNAIDVSGSPPSGFEMFIIEISGLDLVSPNDPAATVSGAGTAGPGSLTTGTLANSSEILIAVCPSPNGNATSAGTGFTLMGAITSGGTGYEYSIVSSNTAVNAKMNVSGDWFMGVVGLQAPASAPTNNGKFLRARLMPRGF